MKSFTKVSLIFSACVIAIGTVLCIIGSSMGARSLFINMLNNGDFSYGPWDWKWGGKYAGMITTDSDEEFYDIEELSVDMTYGELYIYSYEGDSVKVEAKNVSGKYDCYEKGGRLIIDDETRNYWKFFRNKFKYHPVITVYIPRESQYDEVNIEMGAGYVKVENLYSDHLYVDVGAGTMEGSHITAVKESELQSGAGSILIDYMETAELELGNGAGNIEIYDGQIHKEADIKSGVGNVLLELDAKQEDYNYDITCGIGNVTIGKDDYSSIGRTKRIDHDADAEMDVECGVGNVEILFK